MTAVLGVILSLLKWIGILLLCILGLLLLVVILALAVPVRYRAKINKQEEPEESFLADALISWMNPFLRIRIQYAEKKLCYVVRIFGISIMNSKKEKKSKKKKEKRPKKKEEKTTERDDTEKAVGESSPKQPEDTETALRRVQTETKEEAQDYDDKEKVKESKGIKAFIEKIKRFFQKVREFPVKVKQKIKQLGNSLKLLWEKKESVVAFFEEELHRLAIRKAWNTIKQVVCHILPGKIKGHVEFGTGDPESTGKALGVLGFLYAAYGRGVSIVPDFNRKCLVAELSLKGRIRFGTLLFKGLSLIRDKQIKRFYKDWKKLWKILKTKAE